jgi:hypothetical protein
MARAPTTRLFLPKQESIRNHKFYHHRGRVCLGYQYDDLVSLTFDHASSSTSVRMGWGTITMAGQHIPVPDQPFQMRPYQLVIFLVLWILRAM